MPTLSGRAVFALNNALGAIGTMQQAMAQISAAETVIASALAEIEDEFIKHIFSESLSEDILIVSSGRKGKIRGVVFVKNSNGLYLVGKTSYRLLQDHTYHSTRVYHTRGHIYAGHAVH